MNAAFEVHTASAAPVVVRVAQRAAPHFEAERQTLDLLAPHDLPTPRVLALDHHRAADRTLSVIVLSKLEGRQLGQLEEMDGATDDTLVELGRLLARIHTATLEPDVAEHPGWLAGRLGDIDWMHAGAALANVDPASVGAAAEVVRAHPRPTGPRARIHNDFKSGNILVADARVTGIVDFEFSTLDDPARDLAFWAFWHGERRGAVLRRGYEEASDAPADMDQRVALYQMEIALSYLQWFRQRGVWPGGGELVGRNLREARLVLGH